MKRRAARHLVGAVRAVALRSAPERRTNLLTARPISRFHLLEDEDQEKDDQDESDYPTTDVHLAPPI
jgi:hypothetical protein